MQRRVQEGSSRIPGALGQARADGIGKFGAARCAMQIAGQHLQGCDRCKTVRDGKQIFWSRSFFKGKSLSRQIIEHS